MPRMMRPRVVVLLRMCDVLDHYCGGDGDAVDIAEWKEEAVYGEMAASTMKTFALKTLNGNLKKLTEREKGRN